MKKSKRFQPKLIYLLNEFNKIFKTIDLMINKLQFLIATLILLLKVKIQKMHSFIKSLI